MGNFGGESESDQDGDGMRRESWLGWGEYHVTLKLNQDYNRRGNNIARNTVNN